MKIIRSILLNVFTGASITIVLLMVAVAYSDRLHPADHPTLACAGMAFPAFLIANVIMLMLWLIVKWRRAWIPVLGFVLNHDYEGFYAHELAERERFVYPPFVRIINVYLRHREEAVVNEVAARLATLMRQVFGTRVLGPEPPLVSRVQNLYIRQLVLKIEPQASMSRVKAIMRQQYEQLLGIDARARQVRVHYDVDPV